MQITEPGKQVNSRFVPFALGFRPFFLLAGVSGFTLLAIWIMIFVYGQHDLINLALVDWHSHEMIFGYSSAVIAGFLLTAVRNWTGVDTIKGIPLMILALLWLQARILPFTSLSQSWFAFIDMLFLPLLALALAHPLIKVKQWKNLFFVALILLYALANGWFHAGQLFDIESAQKEAAQAGLGVIIMIISVMAGRVVGFFIERGLGSKIRSYPLAEKLALWGTAIYFAGQFLLDNSVLTIVAIIATAGHLLRLVGWHNIQLWRVPLLWVLYLGYAWLVAGFILVALALNLLLPVSLAIHAFTTGAIGVMTLGMMARVALGHTGREMQVHPAINWSFILVNLAVLFRVIMPLIDKSNYMTWMQVSGLLWLAAFIIFSLVYVPVLLKPRVDGMPG